MKTKKLKIKLPGEVALKHFLLGSNAIEGVYSQEAYDDALEAWNYLIKVPKLSVAVLQDVHKILMKNQGLQKDEIGYFRRVPVYIGGHAAVNSIKIPELIESWLLDVETSIKIPGEDGKHIKLDHIEYERIHPWVDGNGRTGRLFMNWQRIQAGLPILIIHEGKEQMAYYKWFKTKE